MFQKFFIISVIGLVLHFLLASCSSKTDCQGRFSKCSLKISRNPASPNFHNPMDTFSNVFFDSLALQSEVVGEVFNCVKNSNSTFLIQSANAFTFAPKSVTISQRIVSIDYISLRNYDASHALGSTLNDIILSGMDWSKSI